MTSDVRPSLTLGEDLRYVAAPVIQDYAIAGAVRLSLPESIVTDQVQQTQRWLVLFLLMVIIAASLVAWWLAKSIASPLRKVAQVAEELPDDLHLRADEESGPPEVRQVASSLNQTAGRLGAIIEHTQRVAADASHHLRTPLTGIRLRLEAIEDVLRMPRDTAKVRADAAEMRLQMARHKPPVGPLDVKLGPGGLIDFEFTVHVLQLTCGVGLDPRLELAIAALVEAGRLDPLADPDLRLLSAFLVVMRLVAPGAVALAEPSRALVASLCGQPGWDALVAALDEARARIAARWDKARNGT